MVMVCTHRLDLSKHIPSCQTHRCCQVEAIRRHIALSLILISHEHCARFNPLLPVREQSAYGSMGVCVCVTHVNQRCILLCRYITVPALTDRYYSQHTLSARRNYISFLPHKHTHRPPALTTEECQTAPTKCGALLHVKKLKSKYVIL